MDTAAVAFQDRVDRRRRGRERTPAGHADQPPCELRPRATIAATDPQSRIASFSRPPGSRSTWPRQASTSRRDPGRVQPVGLPSSTARASRHRSRPARRPGSGRHAAASTTRRSSTSCATRRSTSAGRLRPPTPASAPQHSGALATPPPADDGQEPNDDIREVKPNGLFRPDDADHRAGRPRAQRGRGSTSPRTRGDVYRLVPPPGTRRPRDGRARHRRGRRSLEADGDDRLRARDRPGADLFARPPRAAGRLPERACAAAPSAASRASSTSTRRGTGRSTRTTRSAPRPLDGGRRELDRQGRASTRACGRDARALDRKRATSSSATAAASASRSSNARPSETSRTVADASR